jgi:hypothetical protein
VGIIAFELFTGHTPFQGDESPMTVMYRHVNEPIPPIVSLNRAVPPGISDWVQRLLVKDTAQRSSSAATAWEELEEHVIELLGPRWRRQALLTDREAPSPEAAAATPAPAPGHPTYRTFERAEPHGRAVAGPATPPPASLPPGPMLPSLADVPVGPPTPVPGSAALPAPSPAERVPPAPYATPTSATPATPAPPARVDPSLAAPSASSVTVAPRRASPAAGSGPAAAGSAEGGTPPVRRGRVRLVAAGAGIVALAIVAAVAVTGPDAEPPSPARARAVSLEAAPLRVAVPAGWRADGDAAPEALELKGSAAAVPAGGRGQGAVTIGFASTDARNAALLSAAFRKRLTKDPAAGRQAVRDLPGGLQAYRYDDLQPRDGGAKVTVYAVPTSAGIATLACMAPTTAATCASVARTLSVRGASAFAVGPDAGYATRVDESLRSLDARLDRASAAIRAAKTAKGQAQAASVIARAYRLSRRPLTSLKLSPADVALNARLLAALHSTSAAYAALASAARRTQPKTYRAARTAVRRSQSGVATVLRRLTSSGYGPLLSARFARRAVPQLKLAARPARVVAAPFASVTPPAVLPSTVPPPAILRPSPPSSKPQPKFVP